MGSLWLIGIGPGNPKLLTLKAVEIAKKCDFRFLEGYTALLTENSEKQITDLIGDWNKLMRPEIENPKKLMDLAKTSNVALLVVGDPLQATTHIDLQLRCEENDIECHVVHGISITTLIGATGLQNYRFGRQTTMVYPFNEYIPTSPYETIMNNYQNDLHSLILFDLDPSGSGSKMQQPMKGHEAVDILFRMKKKFSLENDTDSDSIIESNYAVLCCNLGLESQKITYTSLKLIGEGVGWGSNVLMGCMIIPAKLHDVERAALERWAYTE